ncbi:MAG: hypothetical protein Q8N51_19110 [Gammaproteobacteria bacterium]|nr:hypothetical protein [Gammaproteobacteria bacterium]
MQKIDHVRLEPLLGLKLDSASVRELLSELPPAVVTTVEDDTYFAFRREGLALLFGKDKDLEAVFYYPAARDGYSEFKGQLPAGLRFNLNRKGVQDLLGLPERSGGGEEIPFLGIAPRFDRFRRRSAVIHIEYLPKDSGIALITAMSLKSAP